MGVGILLGALVLGALGDGLLRAFPWGLNLFLWIAAICLGLDLLARWGGRGWPVCRRWPLVAAILVAVGFAWRDSVTLKLIDLLAVLALLPLVALPTSLRPWRLALTDWLVAGVLAGLSAAFGAFLLLLGDVRWWALAREETAGRALAVVRGLALGFPLVLIFGGLFAAADAAFAGILTSILRIDLAELAGHAMLTLFLAWGLAGAYRLALIGEAPAIGAVRPAGSMALGVAEVGVVLGLLDALFLGFVLVQLRYFFGGAALVEATVNLTYAEYARRGFFELVTVSVLVLALLLLLHWLLRPDDARAERLFRALAAVQLALLGVIMVSAVQRMRLYQAEYGLTELRLYTTAFMGWIAVVCLWFMATVLRGRRERFAIGALGTGVAAILLLHAINPDELIVRANAERALAGASFDAHYAAGLSMDAVPALVEVAPHLPPEPRQVVDESLRRRRLELGRDDWRAWSWSRAAARAALDAALPRPRPSPPTPAPAGPAPTSAPR